MQLWTKKDLSYTPDANGQTCLKSDPPFYPTFVLGLMRLTRNKKWNTPKFSSLNTLCVGGYSAKQTFGVKGGIVNEIFY